MSIEKVRYRQQRQAAAKRNIEFNLSFEQWWDIWQQSGHWENRGRKIGQYCMSRYGDIGTYEISNVFIQQSRHNVSQAQAGRPSSKKGKSTRPQTTEEKLKNSLAHLGKPKGPMSEEHKQKIREVRKLQITSAETKEKMRLSQLARWTKIKGNQ